MTQRALELRRLLEYGERVYGNPTIMAEDGGQFHQDEQERAVKREAREHQVQVKEQEEHKWRN